MSEQPRRPARAYTSRLRAEQAAATRSRVVTAAGRLFAERGYAGTSMPEIAREAGVSTETVQSHGPKSALLRAAIDDSAFGVGRDADPRATALGERMLSATSALGAVEAAAGVLAEVNRSTHGLWLAFSEAARADPAIAAEFRALAGGIRAQNTALVGEWRARGYLREDADVDAMIDRCVLIGSVELYDRAVRVEGMAFDAYESLLRAMLTELVLRP